MTRNADLNLTKQCCIKLTKWRPIDNTDRCNCKFRTNLSIHRLVTIIFIIILLMTYVSNADDEKSLNPSVNHRGLLAQPFNLLTHLTQFNNSKNARKCDRTFISNPSGRRNGTFKSPKFSNPFNHSRQCIYTFIAAENERVKIKFTKFDLRGTYAERQAISETPICINEYLDIYMAVEDPTMELIDTPFGGRYCGNVAPEFRVSFHRTIVLGFSSEMSEVDDQFEGTYGFISENRYKIGTPVPNEKCGFIIDVSNSREGRIMSPTYPGVYPKGIKCFYIIKGQGQRIMVELDDFDLFYGGPHCPFDYVKFYDGVDKDAPEIGTYCGQHRNLRIYSSSENLYMEFVTLDRVIDAQNRGFNGYYEISERFVRLEFIESGGFGKHIRGTECDQKILSGKESNGTIVSPNYPFPYQDEVVCRYYIYGLQDSQNLERVHLQFEKYSMGKNCTNAFLRVYLRGQEERHAYEEFDYSFCGNVTIPKLTSSGPRMVLVFNSGLSRGSGFKAKYWFETYYQIPGTASPDGSCDFIYRSTSGKSGTFNSPWHPRNYPLNIECSYMLIGNPRDRIEVSFTAFETAMDNITSVYGYQKACYQDFVEIWEITEENSRTKQRLFGRYCGRTTPGPILTNKDVHLLLLKLSTDSDGVSGGFRATYRFLTDHQVSNYADCGQDFINGEPSGVISSPNYPKKYESAPIMCEWFIKVNRSYRILLVFTYVGIEGDPKKRGCSPAAVRVWEGNDPQPIEFCGQSSTLTNDTLVSIYNTLKVKFITSEKAVGGAGFKAVWTKVKQDPECSGFRCLVSDYCIDSSLQCDSEANCGFYDRSDEADCSSPSSIDIYLLIGLILGSIKAVIFGLCYWCHRKNKRRRKQEREREDRHKRFCDATGIRFSSVDSV